MGDKQYSGMTYLHGQWRYFVDKREDNGKFTAFMDSINSGTDDMRTEVATIPDFDTFEEAQDALDGYALKHEFTADSADEMPDAGEDADDAGNPEDTEEKAEPLPDGQDLSLRLPAFSSIFDDADAKLRDLSRAMKTKLIESGELSIKIVINNYGSVLKPDPKKCTVSCNLKPAKVSTPIRFPDDLEITVEKDGRVNVPEAEIAPFRDRAKSIVGKTKTESEETLS